MRLITVTKTQFEANPLEYLQQVEASNIIIVVTDNGQPTVELRRCWTDNRTALDRLRDSVLEFKEPTLPIADDEWQAADT